jgi:hypothetical protein
MTTTNKTTVSGIDTIYQVTADVTLSGMDLLVLMSYVKNGADANVAALKLAQPDGDASSAEVIAKAITAIADSADELLETLHEAYEDAMVALWTERRKDRRYDDTLVPARMRARKVER